jgi:hypothetical protein
VSLNVDLNKTDQELCQDITKLCSEFGVVSSVTVHREIKTFAMVAMATSDGARELAAQFQRTSVGYSVLLFLEQKG